LYGAPRSATIKALENCGFWGIDRKSFRKAVEEVNSKEYEENR
jgi:cGMP-dependent protein kinase